LLETDESIRALSRRVEQLATLCEEANLISRDREQIIDRLHQENQELRAGEIWQAVAPLARDLIRLYDDLKQTGDRYGARSEPESGEAARDFTAFKLAVEDILYRHGVDQYGAEHRSPFNPREHKAVGVVPTNDESLDRTIARVVRGGFRKESKIVRILEAEVFRFTAAPNETENDGADARKTEPSTGEKN
jgi:molecular chaperone GrpE (heat shock protein)